MMAPVKLSTLILSTVVYLWTATAYTPPSTLTYRITYRDFLPSHCLNETLYTALWEYYDSSGNSYYTGMRNTMYADPTLLQSTWYANNTDEAMDLTNSYGPVFSKPIKVVEYCPYWSNGMSNYTLSGHPDFEAAAKSKVSAVSKCYKGGAAKASCSGVTSVIKPNLTIATSGLPKITYCNDTYNSRCGYSESKYTTSRQQYFDAWYNDNAKYNKRVGQQLTVTLNETSGQYQYSSGYFFPLNKYDEERAEGLYSDGPAVTANNYPDPNRAYVWPNSIKNASYSHFWFTTEFHSYFSYSGDEYFKFTGDDDLYVFINGKIAIDLGGTHQSASDDLYLSDYADEDHLNLTVGEVYEFSIFHAERHTTASNFNLYTSISENCNIARPNSGSVSVDISDTTSTEITLSEGVVQFEDGTIQLSNAANTAQDFSTYMFTTNQQNIGPGFIATFSFRVLDEAAIEGLAFVATRRSEGLTNIPVSTGSGLGYRFISNSIAVAIDMCTDRAEGRDCSGQQVSLHYPDDADDTNEDLSSTLRVYDSVLRSLRYTNTKNEPETHVVRIEYLERPDWLQVYIDDSLYLRQTNFSLEDIIGGRDAYIGLTSSTPSSDVGTLEILSFTLETIAVEANSTVGVDLTEDAETLTLVGNGKSSAGFTIQTRDLCGNDVENGGLSSYFKAWYIPTEQESSGRRSLSNSTETWVLYTDDRVNATIQDNLDGTYTALLSTTEPGMYALYSCFGLECGYNWTSLEPLDSESYYGQVALAVRVIPVTSQPTQSPIEYTAATGDDSKVAMYAGIGGGVAGAVLLCSVFALLALRRRWLREKGYIENGKLYRMDRAVEYDPNDEFMVVTRMVMESSADLQRERAKRGPDDGSDAISNLKDENQQLQEQVRLEKQRAQLENSKGSRISQLFKNKRQQNARRKEFNQDGYV